MSVWYLTVVLAYGSATPVAVTFPEPDRATCEAAAQLVAAAPPTGFRVAFCVEGSRA